jgi:hypothetical protein
LSVKLIDNEAFYGFRVRRTVNGKLYQEYYSLKKNGKRLGVRATKEVEKEAQARDLVLMNEQIESKKQRKAELCFNNDGSVKGISYLVKTEKSGTKTPIFQIGIASELEKKIVCTSFSIYAHGKEEAWKKAVAAYAEHKMIRKGTKLYKQILAAMPKSAKNAEAAPAKAKAKPAAKKSTGKKAVAKKPAAKKPAAKKAAAKKSTAPKKTAAKKASVKKKATAKKPAAKKTTAKRKPAAKSKK